MSDLPKSSWRPTAPLRIGEFEAIPSSNELRGPEGMVRLRPLLMDILLRLAVEPGAVVTRETLLADVWSRRMVNDEVLSRAIAELRGVLGDDAKQPLYVETLPKAGYRLVAPVGDGSAGAKVSRARGWRTTALAIACVVAVLAAGFAALGLKPGRDELLTRQLAAARPWTSDVALEVQPRFSSDGARIAYVSVEGEASHIVVQSVDGRARRVIAEAGTSMRSPVFFPDGRRVAFWRTKDNDCAIVEHDLESGAQKVLLGCAPQPHPRFDLSPDGTRLAVSVSAGTQLPAGITIVDLASGRSAALTAPGQGAGDDVLPRFSPDGREVVFFRGTQSHRRAWIARVDDTASARPASGLEGLIYGAAWLAPGGPLVVASDWLGFRALTLLDLRTGEARLLGARGARSPDVNTNGDIVYENAQYQSNLWLVDTATPSAAPRKLWPSTRYTNQAAFAPDGRQVLFVSNRDGVEALYVAALDGEARRLPLPPDVRHIRPQWAPDGRSLYAVRIAIGGARTAVQQAVHIELVSGKARVLEALGRHVNVVRPSADGRWLYVGELSGHAMHILRTPVGGSGPGERLPLPLVSEFQVNAQRLVYTQPELAGATSCSLEGLSCERLDIGLDDSTRYDWLLTARSIYFPLREASGTRLARFDLASGELDSPRDFAPTAMGLALAADAGERRLLMAREEPPAIDLMIAPALLR